MLNKCSYLRVRHKKHQLYYFCTKTREIVQKGCYMGCLDKEYKKLKPIKQKTDKQRKLEESRFSIIQQELDKCYFCNEKSKDWHELLKGRNRKKCIKWGLCVKTCRNCHEKTENDSNFYKETRKIAQKEWQKHYKKSKEEFTKEFGINYLKEEK